MENVPWQNVTIGNIKMVSDSLKPLRGLQIQLLRVKKALSKCCYDTWQKKCDFRVQTYFCIQNIWSAEI